MRRKPVPDLVIAALADEQHGVVTRSQLLRAGLTNQDVDRRVRARRLRRLHQGVYAVGHRALRAEGRWMAATLAVGGVLSHASAAAAWELRASNASLIDVTTRRVGRERRAGLRIHRSGTLTATAMTRHRGIPITTPARTIIDLAHCLRPRELEYIVDLADQRGLIDFTDLEAATPASLKAVLRDYDPPPTKSEQERRFLALCDDHDIPQPEMNTRLPLSPRSGPVRVGPRQRRASHCAWVARDALHVAPDHAPGRVGRPGDRRMRLQAEGMLAPWP